MTKLRHSQGYLYVATFLPVVHPLFEAASQLGRDWFIAASPNHAFTRLRIHEISWFNVTCGL